MFVFQKIQLSQAWVFENIIASPSDNLKRQTGLNPLPSLDCFMQATGRMLLCHLFQGVTQT
jgi:hypothetical protein